MPNQDECKTDNSNIFVGVTIGLVPGHIYFLYTGCSKKKKCDPRLIGHIGHLKWPKVKVKKQLTKIRSNMAHPLKIMALSEFTLFSGGVAISHV